MTAPAVVGADPAMAATNARTITAPVRHGTPVHALELAKRPDRRGPLARLRAMRAVRLSHHRAMRFLRAARIRIRSTGHCVNRHHRRCTSLQAIRVRSLIGLIRLRKRSHCRIVVTGGTEIGHALGRYSHGHGYKVDVARNRCLDRYIIRHRRRGPIRSDGARLYRLARPGHRVIYAREPSHWDITFR